MGIKEGWKVIEDLDRCLPQPDCGVEAEDELEVRPNGIWIVNKGEWWCKGDIDITGSCAKVHRPDPDTSPNAEFEIVVGATGILECLSNGFMTPQVVWTAEENNGIDLGRVKKEKEKNNGEGMRA
jgi:hypothetical protein